MQHCVVMGLERNTEMLRFASQENSSNLQICITEMGLKASADDKSGSYISFYP